MVDRKRRGDDRGRMTIGAALRSARGSRTQAAIGDAMKPPAKQPTISGWESGTSMPTLDQIADFEHACGKPLGFVLRLAGYVEDPVNTRGAIEADPLLDEGVRATLLAIYETAIGIGRQRK